MNVQYVSEYSDLRMTIKKHMYNFNINVGEFLPSFLRFLLLFFALRDSREINSTVEKGSATGKGSAKGSASATSSVTRLTENNGSVTREIVCGKPTSSAGTTSSAASILERRCGDLGT